ncbi:hypothetical protein LTR33_016434, partial [Friedmanniomyces endolithicus]
MICQRCLKRLARRNVISSTTRAFSQSSTARATALPTTATTPHPEGLPAAPSVSAAQPSTTATPPRPSETSSQTPTKSKAAAKLPPSSVPAGTVLKGLNFMKNKQDPVAMEDHEYPDWLWNVLAEKESQAAGTGVNEGDLF